MSQVSRCHGGGAGRGSCLHLRFSLPVFNSYLLITRSHRSHGHLIARTFSLANYDTLLLNPSSRCEMPVLVLLALLVLSLSLSPSTVLSQIVTILSPLDQYVTGLLYEQSIPPLSEPPELTARRLYPFSNPSVTLGLNDPNLRRVNTTSGQLLGQQIVGTGVSVFTGIPYAQAPVDALRWQPPRPYINTSLINATVLGPWCPQITALDLKSLNASTADFLIGEEDCLFLNVWTPANLTQSNDAVVAVALPVMVFVHGVGCLQSFTLQPALRRTPYISCLRCFVCRIFAG